MGKKNDAHFMEEALCAAESALQRGEFPVGCVIADGRKVVATGARRGSRGALPNEIDHAEMTALRALYENGAAGRTEHLSLYCTMEPCLMCFAAIILNRIPKIVYAYEDVMGGGTRCDLKSQAPLYAASGIRVVPGVLRERSLALFKRFFKDPRQSYWKESLLSRYTLSQEAEDAGKKEF